MRVNAYIMAADPAWMEASVLSYYDHVSKFIVSYDEQSLSWTGTALPVDECLARLRAIDRDNKMVFSPGRFARLDHKPMENDTHQRQVALDEACQDADWVIQIDTDEILGDANVFMECLREAESQGFNGMDFPARWLYTAIGGEWYLENCRRFWRISAGYPGPVAVKKGVTLRNARQCDAKLFRVDFSKQNTDPWHPKDTPVHKAVRGDQGIFHFSWVRDPASMRAKGQSSSHALDFDWARRIRHWEWSAKYPWLAVLRPVGQPRRFVRVPASLLRQSPERSPQGRPDIAGHLSLAAR